MCKKLHTIQIVKGFKTEHIFGKIILLSWVTCVKNYTLAKLSGALKQSIFRKIISLKVPTSKSIHSCMCVCNFLHTFYTSGVKILYKGYFFQVKWIVPLIPTLENYIHSIEILIGTKWFVSDRPKPFKNFF